MKKERKDSAAGKAAPQRGSKQMAPLVLNVDEEKKKAPLCHTYFLSRSKLIVQPQRHPPAGASVATTWTTDDVTNWAARQGLYETAKILKAFNIDGPRLLRTDAAALQTYGLTDGNEALRAEGKISQLALNIGDADGSPELHVRQALHTDHDPCPSYSPLATMSTDPWRKHVTSLYQPPSPELCKRIRWCGL